MERKGITLIGMPTSGKSTIGAELARRLEWPLLDVDRWMEEQEGTSLRNALLTKGVGSVLDMESRCIRDHDLHETVVSTPGSIIYNDVYEPLARQTHIVWLDVPLATVAERLAPDPQNMRGVIGLEEKGLHGLYAERVPLYRKWAQIAIRCADKSIDEISAEIIEKTS